MQILAIVLYSQRGKVRILPLEPGRVNIITGRSRTGKSQLIRIVDYCLGSAVCEVSAGPIRNSVAWYGLHLQFASGQMFVARQNPGPGARSTNSAYIDEGQTVTIPAATPVENTRIEDVVIRIGERLGISPNLNIPAEGQSRAPLAANFRHGLFYAFQEQGEIAISRTLFHRQGEPHILQTLKDTLPYFLGVVREDALAIEQRLRQRGRDFAQQRHQLGLGAAEETAGEEHFAGEAVAQHPQDLVPHIRLHPVEGQDDLPLRAQAIRQARVVGEPQRHQFLVALQQIRRAALGNGETAPDERLMDLGHAAMLSAAQLPNQGDDIQAELAMWQRPVPLFLGAVGPVVEEAGGVCWLIIHPGLSLARICTAFRHAAPLRSHKGGMIAPLPG